MKLTVILSFFLFPILLSGCKTSVQEQEERGLTINSSDKELNEIFLWAKQKAESYVYTGQSGKINCSELAEELTDVSYISCYHAGYPFRSAFYIRDYCHQMTGAHLMGLQRENFTMLKAFAQSATSERGWYPLWSLNFNGSPFKLDYINDSCFVREIPAVFELVEKAYKQYLWTADKNILIDPVLWNFYSKAVTDFVDENDDLNPNGIAEAKGTGLIFNGVSSYNEEFYPLIESGDGLACQYQAFYSYAQMLAYRGEKYESGYFMKRVEELKRLFNEEWGNGGDSLYIRGYDVGLNPFVDFGHVASIFMPLKEITNSDAKNRLILRDIHGQYQAMNTNVLNLNGICYLPDLFYRYHMNSEGWYWTDFIHKNIIADHPIDRMEINGDYPEVSFVVLSNVVENIMGIEPDAPNMAFATLSRIPEHIDYIEIKNIPLGKNKVNVTHFGQEKTIIRNVSGDKDLNCKVRFYGNYTQLKLNDTFFSAQTDILNGNDICYINVSIPKGEEVIVEVNR